MTKPHIVRKVMHNKKKKKSSTTFLYYEKLNTKKVKGKKSQERKL